MASTEPLDNQTRFSNGELVDPPSPSTTFRRGETWMDDGNIVLQSAPDKDQVATRFRVHWSILCRYSTVFADMYSVPQPPEQDTVDSCSLVILTDDAKDLDTVLGALYDCFYNQEKLSIYVIDSILRLGKKYDFTRLRFDAIRRLRHDWPTELDVRWCNSAKFQTVEKCHIFEIIRIAFEHGVNVVLPTLFYEVLTCHKYKLPLNIIFDGVEEENTLYQLPSDLVLNCAKAYGVILDKQVSIMFSWLTNNSVIPCAECPNAKQCEAARRALIMVEAATLTGSRCYALNCWNSVQWDNALCRQCSTTAKAVLEEKRRTFWDKLPSYFGLGTWKELMKAPELD